MLSDKRLSIVISLFLYVFGLAAKVQAKSDVYWPYFNIPPLSISHEDGHFTGIGPELGVLLQSQMPEYIHQTIAASPLKIFQSVREGRKWILSGVLKTPSREENLYYSNLPCRMTWTILAVIRKGDSSYLNANGQFRAKAALSGSGYRFGYVKGIDYGDLEPLVFDHIHSKGRAFSSNDFDKLAELLALERIDFFFAGPLIADFILRDSNLSEQIDIVPCLEIPVKPIYGYYAVPKTEWGRKVIAKIDSVLESVIRSGEHRKILQRWTPKQFNAFFDRDYKAGFEDVLTRD
ncbi:MULTISPECIES: transporter substrate-binding domain-containing protein [unclassified Maridesulfovibrio]|uniref:transporter substrate-binding domain-containing protein n=1 Tax=unclassified Maridesulfovibrio TaxID=2794999 RepID=UPI003B3F2F70